MYLMILICNFLNPWWCSWLTISISCFNLDTEPRCKCQDIFVGLDNYYIITQSQSPHHISCHCHEAGLETVSYIWPLFIFLQLVIKVVVKSIRCSIKMFCQVGRQTFTTTVNFTRFLFGTGVPVGFLGDGFDTSASISTVCMKIRFIKPED